MSFSPAGRRSVLLRLGAFLVVLATDPSAAAAQDGVDFKPRIDVVAGMEPLGVAAADMDRDGMTDLVTTVHEEDIVALFRQVRGSSPVRFAPAVEVEAGLHPQEVVLADFDGDALPDVAIADSGRGGGGTLSVFRNTSSPGTISLAPRIDYGVNTARRLAIGDLDADGKIDIAVSSNSAERFEIFRNTSSAGSLSFSHQGSLVAANHPNSLELVDIDGDGRRDLVAPIGKEDILSVYPNTSSVGSISFGERIDFAAGNNPNGPAVGQFDGEGGPDVVVTSPLSNEVYLLVNKSTPGSFAFDPPLVFPAGSDPREAEAGDLDGDGVPDVVFQNSADDTISVMKTVRGVDGVSLELVAEVDTGPKPILSALRDLDGDGSPDLVTGHNDGETVGIFVNATEGAASPDHLLLCEVASTPSAGEFIEIVNPTSETVSLEDYYLSDDQGYALLPGASGAGPAPSIIASDFIVRFPAGSSIEPDGVVVVAMDGAGFVATYGFAAHYEIVGTDAGTPDMLPTYLGGSASITDSGENAVLFFWDGASDLVADVDMVRVGTPDYGGLNDLADKTGLGVDGPDGDMDATLYLTDAVPMFIASSDLSSGESVKRELVEGTSETDTGGNGITGHDETSEDTLVTWDSEFEYLPADPGICCLTLPCYYASVDLTNSTTLRNTLHELIDDHHRWSYDDVWEILELADEDPLDPDQVVDIYKNSLYPKDRIGYNREHSWPSSYGFPSDVASNYPFTDAYQLFLADGSYDNFRGNKPFRDCDGTCDEKVTVNYDGRGGGSGIHPGLSNWTEGEHETGTWETWIGRQGESARALFYLDVRYEGGSHGVTGAPEPNLHLTDNETLIGDSNTGSNESNAYMGILSDLRQWHVDDPVDFREEWRNNVIVRYQRNRNPFVDHPEWVACLYDNVCPGVDLTVSKDDGWPDAVAGETVTYTIEVGNIGPDDVSGATVTDVFDPGRFDVGAITWTCSPAVGAGAGTSCPASGVAADLEAGVVVDVETGDAVVFTVDCPVLGSATGSLVNTATAEAPTGIFERDAASNSDSDTNDLPALGVCGHPDQRVLTATTVTTTELAEACTSITAGSGFRIEDPGAVTLRAGKRIVLEDGFSVGEGGSFVAEIDPALKP